MSAYTQADLDALESAMLKNQSTVSIGGRTVTFKSTDELLKMIEYVRRQIAKDRGRTRLLGEYSKGVEC